MFEKNGAFKNPEKIDFERYLGRLALQLELRLGHPVAFGFGFKSGSFMQLRLALS